MNDKRKRKRNDLMIGQQPTLNTKRQAKRKYEGNLWEIFPALTPQESKGWTSAHLRLFDNIRNVLPEVCQPSAGTEDEIEPAVIENALVNYEKLEQIILLEKRRQDRNEARIAKLIMIKDKYRKRVFYLESLLIEENLTQKQLQRKAKKLGRLNRAFNKRRRIGEIDRANLLNMDIEGQLLKEDQILLAYLKSLFKGIGRKFRVKKVTRLLKKKKLLAAIELLKKAHNLNYIGPLWNLVGKTAYMRSHSKMLVEYLSDMGASGSYTTMLNEIRQLPSIDDDIPLKGACIVLLDNCQNDGKKIYLDRIENKTNIKVVTAFVTFYLKGNASQDIDGPGPWSESNVLNPTLVEEFMMRELEDKIVFEKEQKKFIGTFLNPNALQKGEDEFVERCIEGNEIDMTLEKEEMKTDILRKINNEFNIDNYKSYSEQRMLFEDVGDLDYSDNENNSGKRVANLDNNDMNENENDTDTDSSGLISEQSEVDSERDFEDTEDSSEKPEILISSLFLIIDEPILIAPNSIDNMRKILDILKEKYHIGIEYINLGTSRSHLIISSDGNPYMFIQNILKLDVDKKWIF